MACAQEADMTFDLDYDEDIGETCRAQVDPWTGEILPEGAPTPTPRPTKDPDSTSRVQVDPWTGQVISVDVEDLNQELDEVETVQPMSPQAVSGSTVAAAMAQPKRYNRREVTAIALAAALAGSFIGGTLTLAAVLIF